MPPRFAGYHEILSPPDQTALDSQLQPNPPIGQNHDRNSLPLPPFPPPPDIPALPLVPYTPATTAATNNAILEVLGLARANQAPRPSNTMEVDGPIDHEHHSTDGEEHTDTDDHSESDQEDSEDEGTGFRNGRWRPIPEDSSAPCEDELAYIKSKPEYSANDHKHWEAETFFDLDDPEFKVIGSGRIDWLVDKFNGTEESPNKEVFMRSHTAFIGGYVWRIKLYPRGNHSDYISVYVENVTMQQPDYDESRPFKHLPFPVLAGQEQPQQLRSAAVQLCVVMYNPAEPRTYEYHVDAHQFTKKSPDYGWTRFTRYPRRDFYLRNHGQRQAILRDDKLAFSAYIRVVNDPTGCLWAHGDSPYEDSIAMTSLRPWSPRHPQFAAFIMLLHFPPFRALVTRFSGTSSRTARWQMFLWKMLSRTRSENYGLVPLCPINDPMRWFARAVRSLQSEMDPDVITEMIGAFSVKDAAFSNRLQTKSVDSIQAALDSHPSLLATPTLLSLELQRQEFDRDARRWNKLTNRVNTPDHISVPGKFYPTRYTLFGLITHVGPLSSHKFNFYVRPHGPGTPWYGYTDGRVTCLTRKQAVDKHAGVDPVDPAVKPKRANRHGWRARQHSLSVTSTEDDDEVTHVVMYVRDDIGPEVFNTDSELSWNVPEAAKYTKPPNANDLNRAEDETFQAQHVAANCEIPTTKPNGTTTGRHSTPEIWPRDDVGDIVMSDAENSADSSIASDKDDRQDEKTVPTAAAATTIPSTNTSNESSHTNDRRNANTKIVRDGLGQDYYAGESRGARYWGEGHLIKQNGDEYRGQFVAGEPHGEGTMIYASSGDKYTGSWHSGAHHGQGTLTEHTSGNVFEGGWRHGRKHGSFVLRGAVTDEDKGACSICYEREINTAFYDCGHCCACKPCAAMLESCPLCRKRILGRIELFGVKVRVE